MSFNVMTPHQQYFSYFSYGFQGVYSRMIGVVRILSLLKTHYVQARGDVEDAGADPHVSPRAPGAGRYLLAYYMFFFRSGI